VGIFRAFCEDCNKRLTGPRRGRVLWSLAVWVDTVQAEMQSCWPGSTLESSRHDPPAERKIPTWRLWALRTCNSRFIRSINSQDHLVTTQITWTQFQLVLSSVFRLRKMTRVPFLPNYWIFGRHATVASWLSNFQSSCCFLILPLFVLPPHFPDLWRPQVVYSNFFDLSNCRFHELFCGFLALLCRLAAVASRFFKFLWVFKLWFPCSLCSSWSLRFFRLAWLEFLVLSVVKKVSSA